MPDVPDRRIQSDTPLQALVSRASSRPITPMDDAFRWLLTHPLSIWRFRGSASLTLHSIWKMYDFFLCFFVVVVASTSSDYLITVICVIKNIRCGGKMNLLDGLSERFCLLHSLGSRGINEWRTLLEQDVFRQWTVVFVGIETPSK